MDVYIIHNNESVKKRIGDAKLKVSPFFHFINDETHKGRKESWKIKGSLGARLTPFIAVYEDDIPIKAFYSEADDDVVESLINYLNS